MNETPHHTYQVLTKRAERLAEISDQLNWTPNIWMGTSIEDDRVLDRMDYLKRWCPIQVLVIWNRCWGPCQI